jgi:hypothetical protein
MILEGLSQAHSLAFWEHAEYVATAFVVLACLGEAIAEFSRRQRKWHRILGLASTIVLVVALSGELISVIRVNTLFDSVMGDLDHLAGDAAQKAIAANVAATQAIAGAKAASRSSEFARIASREAISMSENAKTSSRSAMQQVEAAEQRSHVATLIAEINADDAFALDNLREMTTFIDESQAKAVKDAIREAVRIHREPTYRGKAEPPWRHALDEKEAEASLDSADPDARQNGLRVLQECDPLVPKLFRLAVSDSSIDVRGLALDRFNDCTGQRFRRLEEKQLQHWWQTEGEGYYDKKVDGSTKLGSPS